MKPIVLILSFCLTLMATIGMFVGLAGCSSGKLAEERSPGHVVFADNCQTCHRLPKPKDRTDSEWPVLVERYGQKAKLSAEQVRLIIEYLQSAN